MNEDVKTIFMQVINKENLFPVVDELRESLKLPQNSFLVLTVDPYDTQNVTKYINKFFIFYELDPQISKNIKQRGTTIHKKLRTYYTINALNALIKSIIGKEDKEYIVDWEQYRNSILFLNKDGNLNIIKTRFYKKI